MKKKNASIGDRMKDYETRARSYLQRRSYTIIRIDGKVFHTYTRGLEKPFDDALIEDMQATTKYLCENVQGCKLGYHQSDEISLLLTDFDTHQTDALFDGQIQKMCSVVASMATAKFNQLRLLRKYSDLSDKGTAFTCFAIDEMTMAVFDARCFNVPTKEEALNYFIWRQRDSVKNSISMLAQSLYSHKELQNKNGNEMQELIFQKGTNWNDIDPSKKRGSTLIKRDIDLTSDDGDVYVRPKWKLEFPNFGGEGDFDFNEVLPNS